MTQAAASKKTTSVSMQVPSPTGSGAQKMNCDVDISQSIASCTGMGEAIFTKDAVYEKTGPKWKKSTPTPAEGSIVSRLTNLGSMWSPETTTIAKSTPEQLDGTQCTHYELVIDLAKAATAARDETLRRSAKTMVDGGVTQQKLDLWITAENLPAKTHSVTPPMKVMGMQIPEMTTILTYQNWGKPVSITTPPADQIQG